MIRKMEERRRTFKEVLSLYKVEPTLRDIYVEGLTDKSMIKCLIKKHSILDIRVIEISEVNFDELYGDYPQLKNRNKKKVIKLAMELERSLSTSLKYVMCIIDQDFDIVLKNKLVYYYLYKTDYFSMESYCICENIMDKFLSENVKSFHLSAKQILSKVVDVLVDIFVVKMVIYEIKGDLNLIDMKKTYKVKRKTGDVMFEFEKYVSKLLQINGNPITVLEFMEIYNNKRRLLTTENRNQIHGKVFLEFMSAYLRKMQNNVNFSSMELQELMFRQLCKEDLLQFRLFKKIHNKYK